MMKRFILLGLILTAGLIGLSSCTEVARPLEGTWTVDSTEIGGGARVLGDGTVTLSFLTEAIGMEFYTGTGTFVGGVFDYIVEAVYWPGFGVTIELSEVGDTDSDYVSLEDMAYSGGGTMTGDYAGVGEYAAFATKDIGDGTFTATK